MGESIRHDILLKISTGYDERGMKKAFADLDKYEQRVRQLQSKQIAVTFKGSAELEKAVKAAKDAGIEGGKAGRNLANGFDAARKSIDESISGLERFKTKVATSAKGLTRTTDFLRGPGGLSASVVRETGATTFISDLEKDAQARVAVQGREDAALRASLAARENQRQQNAKIVASMAADERRAARERLAAQAESDAAIQTSLQAKERERAERARILRAMTADEQKAARERAIAETERLQVIGSAEGRVKNLATFKQVSGFAGFKELPANQVGFNVTKSGALSQDRVLVNDFTGQVIRLNAETGKLTASTVDLSNATKQSGDTFQSAAGKVLLWTIATGLVFGTLRALKSGIGIFTEVEAATVSLERVGRGFSKSLDDVSRSREIAAGARQVTDEILKLKVAFGATGTEAQEAAIIFARLGLNQREVVEATRVSLLASNVAGIGAAQAAKLLAAAMSQFQLSASDLPDVLNKLNELENTTRVRTEDLLHAISRAGAVFREAGGSLEQLAGFTSAVSQATGRSGAEIGNAFKTIASNLGNANVQAKVFDETGVAVRNAAGSFKPIQEVLGELVVKFQNLSDAERASITTSVAGVRQRNILQSALDNYFLAQTQVIRQYESEGSATKENEKILGLLSTRINQLVAAFERLAATLGRSLGGVLGTFVGLLRYVVDALTSLGPAAAVLAGVFTAYSAAVILSTVSTGGFTGSMALLFDGVAAVNGSMVGLIQRIGLQSSAAGVGTAANAAYASSFGTLANAARAAATSMIPLLAIAAPILAVAGAVAGIRRLTGAGRQVDALNPESATGRRIKNADETITLEENKAKALSETSRLAKIAGQVLSDAEAKEAKGVALTTRQLDQKKKALDAIAQLSILERQERDKLNQGDFKAGDAFAVSERARTQAEAQKQRQIEAVNGAIQARKDALSALAQERAKQDAVDRNASFLTFGFRGPRRFFQSSAGFQNENQRQQRELEAQIRETESNKAALEARLLEVQADAEAEQQFERAKQRLQEIKNLTSGEFSLRIGVTSDPVAKARLELEQSRRLTQAISEDSFLDADAKAEALREQKQKNIELERELRLREKIKSFEDREKFIDRNFRVEEARRKAEADIGDHEGRPTRQADAEIRDAEERLNFFEDNLSRLRKNAADAARQAAKGIISTTFDPAALTREEDNVRKAREALDDARAKKSVAQVEEETNRRNEAIERANRRAERIQGLRDSLARTAADRLRPGETAEDAKRLQGIREAQALAQAEINTLARLKAERAALARQGQDSGLTIDQKAQAANLDEQIKKEQDRVEERKINVIEAQLELVRKIGEERRKQIEDTKRELAALSDIDLARVRIFANQVKTGQRGPLSQAEFLNADQETRSFFQKADKLFPGLNILPEDLRLGLGDQAFEKGKANMATIMQEALKNIQLMAPAELRGAIQNATLDAGTVIIQGVPKEGQPATALPPTGANISVNVGGFEAQGDRIVNAIALAVAAKFQELVDANVDRGERSVKAPFRAPART